MKKMKGNGGNFGRRKVDFELKNKSEYRTRNEKYRSKILTVTSTFFIPRSVFLIQNFNFIKEILPNFLFPSKQNLCLSSES